MQLSLQAAEADAEAANGKRPAEGPAGDDVQPTPKRRRLEAALSVGDDLAGSDGDDIEVQRCFSCLFMSRT